MSRTYYLYADDHTPFVNEHQAYLEERGVRTIPFSKIDQFDIDEASHLLVTGTLEEIKELLMLAEHAAVSVGIIPKSEQKELRRTFALPSDMKEAIALALTPAEKKMDLLYAGDTIVLQEAVVGDAPPLDQFDSVLEGKNLWERGKLFVRMLRRVKQLKHHRFVLKNGKENEIKFSAVGLVGLKYGNETFASKLIPNQLCVTDGKLSVVILSPSSIVQYMGYLFKSLVSHLTPKRLPKSVGYIRSSTLYIEADEPLDIVIDSTHTMQTPLLFEAKEKALSLSVGEKFWERQSALKQPKDSIKIDHIPSDEESSNYLGKAIPFFTHASQARYASLFTNLREEAQTTSTFMTLLLFATMIATFGLYINSSSVIIGAMLLAPLMQPIVSLSMGVLRQDNALVLGGLKTIAVGVASVLFTAMIISFFTPMEKLTSEMAGRLSPTILDLFVAIVSGAAAAYAKSNEKILGSLAGVAIAVALVPPIAVAGIGLGWGEWHMFTMAFLLFTTNLVGIVLAAALMFLILGYSPLHIARKGVMVWMVIVAMISIPLYSSFKTMRKDIRIQRTLSNTHFLVEEEALKLTNVELIHRTDVDEIRCEVITSGRLSKTGKTALRKKIESLVGKEVDVIVTFRYRL
jgi:uncharacterized hydrophobic protein (TIGR00271 family)